MRNKEPRFTLAQLKNIVYNDVESRKFLQDNGVNITRSDFYSEIPTISEIHQSGTGPNLMRLFTHQEQMIELLQKLIPFSLEFNPPKVSSVDSEYFWENTQYSHSDAMVYYCMIRLLRPKNILEIGSGYSALIATKALKKNGFGKLRVIEPYPKDFLKSCSDVELIERKFQEIDTEVLAGSIEPGDFIFIDSTHSMKHGSEVLNIYLDFLHLIDSECYVHVHDVYLPNSFPKNLMVDHQVFWGEQYLLYAYMLNNDRTRILYGSQFHQQENHDLLIKLMANKHSIGGASLWFKQDRL